MKNNLCDARYGTIALLACLAFGPLFAAEPGPAGRAARQRDSRWPGG
jgi:hypothetical protein